MATISIRRRVRAPAPQAPPPPVRQGLRASAQRFPLKGKTVGNAKIKTREWQTEAWDHFDEVPEIKYSTWYMGNVMAKVRLFPAVRPPGDPEATPIPASDPASGLPAGAAARAQAEIDRLTSPHGGRAEIVRALNMNLEIAAEGFLIGFGPRETPILDPTTKEQVGVELIPEEWGIYSISQLEEKGGNYSVKLRPDDKDPRKLDPNLDSDPIRIWQRHARWTLEADNNMRGVLGECESLVLLQNSIKAEAKSRMSAGYLLIPNELSTGPDNETEPEGEEEATVDPFLQEIYEGAVDPVEDPSSAAAVAPTMIRGPADALKEFRHVSIVRTADASVLSKITAAIERIARGMNLPVEVVMGHQQTTFANALQVKQDTFDDHFQPRCVLICDGLTVGYMQPNLIAAGMDPAIAERIIVWFDPSAMIKQVNPVDSADQGITLDLISGEAWRRAWGWSEDDRPDPVEQLIRAVMHLRSFDPGISTAILSLLGVPLEIPQVLPGKTTGDGTTGPPALPPGKPEMGLQNLLAAALAHRVNEADGDGKIALDRLLVDLLQRDPAVIRATAKALPPAKRNIGVDLMLIDRELRSRLIVAANEALTRALERAGNRLRAKAGKTRELLRAGFINSIYYAATLGPRLVAAAGFADDDLISKDAWNGLEGSYRAWVAAAQAQSLALIGKVVPISPAQRDIAEQTQARCLDESWLWFKDELHRLAVERLYAPDPPQPAQGEFDPSVRIPAGLVRIAIGKAGGATKLTMVKPRPVRSAGSMDNPGPEAAGSPTYVALDDGGPVGGIGTGDTIDELLSDGGGGVDGYQWEYGPAFRKHEFEPHLYLDQEVFQSFDDDILVAGDWIGDFYFPGDHDGCQCDITPIVMDPGAFADSQSASGITDLGTLVDEGTVEIDPSMTDVAAPADVGGVGPTGDVSAEDRILAAITDPESSYAWASTGNVNLGGIDDATKSLIADRVVAFAEEYPSAALQLQNVAVDDFKTATYIKGDGAGVFAGVRANGLGQDLFLNEKWWTNPQALEEALTRGAQPHFDAALNAYAPPMHPLDGLQAVLDHELGHVLDNAFGITLNSLEFSGLAADTAEVIAQIGTYAARTDKELFAELFAIRQAQTAAGISSRSAAMGAAWIRILESFGLVASAKSKRAARTVSIDEAPWIPQWVIDAMRDAGTYPED